LLSGESPIRLRPAKRLANSMQPGGKLEKRSPNLPAQRRRALHRLDWQRLSAVVQPTALCASLLARQK